MANEILQSQAELANLFEDSLLALTEEGEKRAAALQRKAAELKKKVHDLEMLFAFVKKLMDANAEVCFLAGAHFASTQVASTLKFLGGYCPFNFFLPCLDPVLRALALGREGRHRPLRPSQVV